MIGAQIQDIKNLIAEAKIEEALDKLMLMTNEPKSSDHLILMKARYSGSYYDFQRGIITVEEFSTEKNRINQALLNTLQNYSDSKELQTAGQIYQNEIISIDDAIKKNKYIKKIVSKIKSEEEIASLIKAMDDIKRVLSDLIPEFKELTSDIHNKVFNQIREENLFKIESRRVFVFGKTNAGKTTTINNLLNESVFPASTEMSLTKSLACVEHEGGLIFYDSPGIGDEREPENVTRLSLRIPPLRGAQISSIRLFDVTRKKTEGPVNFQNPLNIESEVNVLALKKKGLSIIAKEYKVEDFQNWVDGKFDFYVFILAVGSGHALDMGQVDFLEEFYSTFGNNVKLFKVLNIWNDGHKSRYNNDVNQLEPDLKIAIKQASERLQKQGLPEYDKWFTIESNLGIGFDTLIKGFADSLPPDVLAKIERTIKNDYIDIIQNKIDEFFYNYAARIASIVATHPVDTNVGGENLFSFALKSLFMISDYLYQGNNYIPASVIDDMIAVFRQEKFVKRKKLKKVKKYKKTPETYTKYVGTGDAFQDNVRSFFGVANYVKDVRIVNKEYIDYETKKKRYYLVGGTTSISFTLAITKAIQKVCRKNTKISEESFKREIQHFQNLINTSSIYIPENLRKWKNRNNRTSTSEKIYPQIRGLIK